MAPHHLSNMAKDLNEPKYEDLEYLHGIVHKQNYDYITEINQTTVNVMGDEWADNVKFNKRYWRKHQKLIEAKGIGTNKCVIGIGSGPSFHKNKDVVN